jgi:hypothetical protein
MGRCWIDTSILFRLPNDWRGDYFHTTCLVKTRSQMESRSQYRTLWIKALRWESQSRQHCDGKKKGHESFLFFGTGILNTIL